MQILTPPTHIFSFSFTSTVSMASWSLKRKRSSRSGNTLSGVMDSWTLDRALDCSARFPRDSSRGTHSANKLVHIFWLFSRPWKLFCSASWSDATPGLDIFAPKLRHWQNAEKISKCTKNKTKLFLFCFTPLMRKHIGQNELYRRSNRLFCYTVHQFPPCCSYATSVFRVRTRDA